MAWADNAYGAASYSGSTNFDVPVLSATSTVPATCQKGIGKVLSASIATTATVAKAIGKTLSISTLTAVSCLKAINTTLSVSASVTASCLKAIGKVLSASTTVSVSISKAIAITLVAPASVVAWLRKTFENFGPTRGDRPNWNMCARCLKRMRPNKLLQQMEYRGPRLVWTGLYVCAMCEDQPQPQNITPRQIGGDPRPVPNARPRRT